jgi:hypothetical protein
LTLIISKVASDPAAGKPSDAAGPVTSDLRQVTYWLADGGLARLELPVVTSDDAVNGNLPGGDDAKRLVIAPEVRNLTFGYFDGTSWQDSWDSTALGPDGITPQGSPRAISITIDLAFTRGNREQVRTYRHVVAISTANGTTVAPSSGTNQSNNSNNNNGGGTSP